MAGHCATVFFYCSPADEVRVATLVRGEGFAEVFTREACRGMDPAALAESPGQKAIFVRPSMMDFLDRYLEACPAGRRHLLLFSPNYGDIPYMSRIFHDFWEERGVDMEELFDVPSRGR